MISLKLRVFSYVFLGIFLSCTIPLSARSGAENSSGPGEFLTPVEEGEYKLGVQLYLEGQDKEAIKHLLNVLGKNPQHINAKKLISKIMKENSGPNLLEKNQAEIFQVLNDGEKPLVPQKQRTVKSESVAPIKKSVSKTVPVGKPQNISKEKKPIQNPSPIEAEILKVNFSNVKKWTPADFVYLNLILVMGIALLLLWNSKSNQKTIFENALKHQADLRKIDEEKWALCLQAEINKKMETERQYHHEALNDLNLELEKLKKEKNQVSPQKWESAPTGPSNLKFPFQNLAKNPWYGHFPTSEKPKISSETKKDQKEKIIEILIDVPSADQKKAWDKIAEQSQVLFRNSPGEALELIKELAEDKRPLVRCGAIVALEKIGVPNTIDILFSLSQDEDSDVRRGILKAFKSLRGKIGNISDSHRSRINAYLQEELAKGDWII